MNNNYSQPYMPYPAQNGYYAQPQPQPVNKQRTGGVFAVFAALLIGLWSVLEISYVVYSLVLGWQLSTDFVMRILALFGMAITLLIRKKFPVAITMSIYVMYLILNIIPLLYPPINAGNLVLSMMLMLAFACAVALVMLSNFGV